MITILGTRGEIEESSSRHKEHSGILIDDVLFDCGETSYLKLKPRAIFLTHLHPDHMEGIKATAEIPIYSLEKPKVQEITWHQIKPLREYGFEGEMTIIPIPTYHSKKVKSCGFLILRKKKRIFYSSDLYWIKKKHQSLIKNCDLVITEGSSFSRDLIRKDKKTGEVYGHASIPKLVKLFKKLGAKQIIITHFGKWLVESPEKGYRKIKELGNDIKVWPAKDGEKIELEKLQLKTEQLPSEAKIVIMPQKEFPCPFCEKVFETKKALRKHLKEKHPQEAERWLQLSNTPETGLYLVPPHGKWIAEGKKTLIIKSKRFTKHLNEPLYLLEGDLCYGIISLKEPKEIDPKTFKKLREKHKVSDKEAFEKWGWKKDKPLYSYEFSIVKIFKEPKKVKIPRGVQVFVNAKNLEFLSKEELIADWKSYDPLKLIKTKGGRRILADDHRIVHTWWNRLKQGKAMKSKQFKAYSLKEQKEIVKKLHEKIIEAFKKLGWKHRTPMAEDALIGSPEQIKVKDLEEVDPEYIKGLSDKQVKALYYRLHWLYHNILKRITEPLINAHSFVLDALDRRNIRFRKVGDRLDKISERIVEEYPSPRGFASAFELSPEMYLDELSKDLSLREVLDKFPDLIVLEEDPVHVYLCGGTVNRGKLLKGHDVDILFKQNFADARIIHQFVDEISQIDKDLGRKLHFVWDPWGPTIGYSVPLYRLAFKKLSPRELRVKNPYEFLAQRIQVMKPYRMLKPKSGFHKFEFFEVQEFWDKWGAKNIDKGIIVQKKYDGMRFQIHVKDKKIKIITEDKLRDRASMFKKSVQELLSKKKADSFVIDAEMVEYNCFGKKVKDKEEICEPLKREKMIPWVTATKQKLDDENIVFHIHDCLFFNGQDIHEKGYEERWKTIDKCFPPGLEHWRKVRGTEANTIREFFKAVAKERSRKGSEGVVAKIKDSPYLLTGRTPQWAKLKNLKEIDVMVWDIQQKKTKAGTLLNQWIYYPVFLVPCKMKEKIRADQFIEWKGKCYARLGRAYGTKVRCKRGDIITIRPIQIVENKDPKTGKIWWSWMFPYFEGKKPEKKEPDTITTVRRIVKLGTGPMPEHLEAAKIIKLPSCPYWNDPSVCPLRERFWVPEEELSGQTYEEYLKIPVVCRFANRFKCKFVKDYYYDLRPVKEYNEEEIEYMEED